MYKTLPSWLSETHSLVDMAKRKQGSAMAKPSWPTSYDAGEDNDTTESDDQLHELKTKLRERDAALEEREAKCEQQAAIIETLVHHLSEIEDHLEHPNNNAADSIHRDLDYLQAENAQLLQHVQCLESELVETKTELQALKFLFNEHDDYQVLDYESCAPTNRYRAKNGKGAFGFPGRKCKSELNIAQLLVETESKNVFRRPTEVDQSGGVKYR